MARSVTIRRSLLLNLGLLVVGLCAAIVAVTVYTGQQIVGVTSRRLIDRTLDRAVSELGIFFEPVERNLRMGRGWLEAGTLDPTDDASLDAFFRPLLEAYPQISSVNLGDEAGRNWMLLRTATGWYSRRIDPPASGDQIRFRERAQDGSLLREERVDPSESERYDPRTRVWYRMAWDGVPKPGPGVTRPDGIYWTEAYEFFTTREPGITATVHVETPSGRWLLAFDILLRDLSAFTQEIEVTPNGFVGVLSADRKLLGVPRLPQLANAEAVRAAQLKRPGDLGIAVVEDAIANYQRLDASRRVNVDPVGSLERGWLDAGDSIFAFESGGARYWADVRIIVVPPDQKILVVANIPERDLLGPIRQLRAGVLAVTALALLAAIASAYLLARRYSLPLAALARSSARIRRLDLRAADRVQSGITEISELAGAQESMRTTLDAFSRYVPTDVVRELVELGEAARIGGERKELTVMFSDIEGFTKIAERKSPEELTHHLAGYFEAMLSILDEIGTVDKLVGDGIMAFWGAPHPDPHHARHALEAVLDCEARLAELNRAWQAEGEPPLPTRFGLASGPALVGNVGSARRLSYTAVGDVVNLASRLESLNRVYGTRILAADGVRKHAGDRFEWRTIDRVRVVGRDQSVEIHELLGRRDAVPARRRRFAQAYERALAAYRKREFARAVERIDALEDAWRTDLSVARLRTSCMECLEAPPPADWEPITLLTQK